mmetsp:Transcript_43202/g.78952  ORF Transcript_43202/g.78952 Transcript_43202/m.78952 type:complete len:207 (-) Transcript_43202:1434-2054(-)
MKPFFSSVAIVAPAFLGAAVSAFTSGVTIQCRSSHLSSTAAPSLPPPVVVADANHPLIQLANEIIYTRSGFYSEYDESVFSDEFVFRGPYIGPLNKKDYLETMDGFGIYKAFPDINPNVFGFSIDPLNPNKVWFMIRNTGTFTGEPGLGLGKAGHFPPNGATLNGCPETFSMEFDEDKKTQAFDSWLCCGSIRGQHARKGSGCGHL